MEISGKIIQILPEQTIGQAGKTKQTVVLETDGQYPKKIAFDIWNDKFPVSLGESVTIGVNVESREWEGKWFTSLTGWKKEGAAMPQPSGPAPTTTGGTLKPRPEPAIPLPLTPEEESGLPW